MNARQSLKNHWQGTVESVSGGRMRVHVLRSRRDRPGLVLEMPVPLLPGEERPHVREGVCLRIWFGPKGRFNVRMVRARFAPEQVRKCREEARRILASMDLSRAAEAD